MGYSVLKIKKLKTSTALINRQSHDYRTKEVLNADKDKSPENKVIIENQYGTYEDAYNAKINESPAYKYYKPRCDAVKALDVMLTFSHESIGKIDMEQWEELSVKWLKDTFGADNVVSVVEHNDEQTPHLHAIVIPMHNERLNASEYVGSPAKMSALQSSYGKAVEPVGLKRGLKYSVAKQEVLKAFYAKVNEAYEKELPEVERKESAVEYRNRVNEEYQKLAFRCLNLEQKLEQAQNRGSTLSLTEKIELREEVSKANEENTEIKNLIEEIERERPNFPVVQALEAISKADEYAESHPEDKDNVVNLYRTMGNIIQWDEKEKAKRKQKEADESLEKK